MSYIASSYNEATTKLDKSRPTIRAITLLLVASILTTCGDDSSSSNDDRGVYGDMANPLRAVADTVFTDNAALYASMDYMVPHIASLLDANVRKVGTASGPQPCLTDGIGGRVYTINGLPFTSVVDPQIPEYTARFRLFRLSVASEPLLDQEIGHVDYTCADLGVPVTEVQLFRDSILVASTTYLPSSGLVSGTLRSPDAAVSLAFLGEPQLEGHLNYRFITSEYEVNISERAVEDGSAHHVSVRVNAVNDDVAPETLLHIGIPADSAGDVSDGAAYYTESPIMRGVACIVSGTIETPIFSPPTRECFDHEIPLLATNSAQRSAMLEIYQSARAYWLRATAQTEICRSLVPE